MSDEKTGKIGVFLRKQLINNAVTILFFFICIAGIILADQPMSYIIGEISSRLFRNLILILALLVKAVGVRKVMRFLPPVVTGPIIICIGLNLA